MHGTRAYERRARKMSGRNTCDLDMPQRVAAQYIAGAKAFLQNSKQSATELRSSTRWFVFVRTRSVAVMIHFAVLLKKGTGELVRDEGKLDS